MTLDRAQESLQAAQLCLREALVNSATSRAYYAMFQAAQIALQPAGAGFVSAVEEAVQHGIKS